MDAHAVKRLKNLTGLSTPITPSNSSASTPISPFFNRKFDTNAQVSSVATSDDLPDQVIPVSDEGDVIIVASGIAGRPELIGLRVSSEVLCLTSPVFKRMLAETQPVQDHDEMAKPVKILMLTNEDGSALCTLCNILHLRNEVLPAHLDPTQLGQLVEAAAKYSCLAAVSRATSPWFDHIYTRYPDPPLYKMTQVAMILNDSVYFARFSSRWVLRAPLNEQLTPTISMRAPLDVLSKALLQRQKDGIQALRIDLDDLTGILADVLCKDNTHYVDGFPGDNPTPVDLGGDPDPELCPVDKEGAILYLAALRDAKIWPVSTWRNTNLFDTTEAIANLRIPEYDGSESCHFCTHIVNEFSNGMDVAKVQHEQRLWGLCLECFVAKGVNPGNCRYEHEKPPAATSALRSMGDASGRQG